MQPNENYDLSVIAMTRLRELRINGGYVICRNDDQVSQMLYICGLLGDERYDNAYQYGRQGYAYFYRNENTVCYGSSKMSKEVEFSTFLESVMNELTHPLKFEPVSLMKYLIE